MGDGSAGDVVKEPGHGGRKPVWTTEIRSPFRIGALLRWVKIEVIAHDPYQAQVAIAAIPEVASVTQLGVRLRVLIPDTHGDPAAIVGSALRTAGLQAEVALSSATLEDVFVAVTLKPQEMAA